MHFFQQEDQKKQFTYLVILFFFCLSDGVFDIALPLYLLYKGHSMAEIGLMLSAISIGIVVFRLFVSMHSDVVGRKIYVVLSLAGNALACMLLPFGNSMVFFTSIFVLRGACRGAFLAVRAPIMKDICAEEERGKMLGMAGASSTVGAAAAGILTGALYSDQAIWILFDLIGALYIIAVIFTVWALEESREIRKQKNVQEKRKWGVWLEKIKTTPHSIKWLCGVNVIQNMVTPPLWSMILPIYFTSVIGATVKTVGFVFTLDNFLSVPSSLLGGIWADRGSIKRKAICLTILCGLLILFSAFVKGTAGFVIFILAFMMSFSLNCPILEKAESVSARAEESGVDFGLISASVALGNAAGSALFGYFIQQYGFRASYLLIGFGYMVIAGFLGKLNWKHQSCSKS